MTAPKITQNALSSDNSTTFYDATGKVITRMGAQNRDYVQSKDIPTTLENAVVSIEDRRFYKHHGVDPIRIVGAAASNLTGSSLGLQGGSTLTQQLVKLSVFSTKASDRTFKRKAQEAWLAMQVEKQYSKQQILEFYINKVYMDNGIYGMQTAARYYYGKSLSQLSLSQLALLAGMPQSPVNYDPYRYPQYATQRRNEVLTAMVKSKYITQAQANAAENVNVKTGLLSLHSQTAKNQTVSKYIDSYLKQTLIELQQKGYKPDSGLKVYTNIDMNAQKKLYQEANNDPSIYFPDNQFQIGATLVDPNSGKVLAMLGGRKINIAMGLNRAVQTDRSSGSTAKPIMDYGPAIENLYYPTYQPVRDIPFEYPGTSKKLMDFDDKYQGTITMRKALVESRNIPAVRTLQNVGISKATQFLGNLGMTFKNPLTLQNGIGLYISTEQLAASYAAFANGGTYYKPYLINKVVQPNGDTKSYRPSGKRAMSPATAFMITDMLKGVMTDKNGSGTAAKVPGLFEAGKTGTTMYPDNYVGQLPSYSSMDAWFSGYTKNYSLAIWTGYDHQFQPGHYVSEQQSLISQQIYKSVMGDISTSKPNTDWQAPNDVVPVQKNGQTEYYVAGHPGTVTDTSSNASESYKVETSGSSRTTVTSPNQNKSTTSSTNSHSSSGNTSTVQKPSGGSGNNPESGTSSTPGSTSPSSTGTGQSTKGTNKGTTTSPTTPKSAS